MGKNSNFEMIDDLIHNYMKEERSIVEQLYFKYKHGTTIGSFREEVWKEMFENIVPKKFVVEQSVFIIDSNGQVSNEVDLAIFDETYTPYIFRKGRLKFIPIEAVAVAVECKSSSAKPEDLKGWVESVRKLKTSRKSIARMHTHIATELSTNSSTQTATRPILIYCSLEENLNSAAKQFDFVLRADKVTKKISITYSEEQTRLKEWFNSLNHADKTIEEDLINTGKGFEDEEGKKSVNYDLGEYRIFNKDSDRKGNDREEVSLLSFNFMLNQLLMLINNPMLFPHMAYVNMFNKEWDECSMRQPNETAKTSVY